MNTYWALLMRSHIIFWPFWSHNLLALRCRQRNLLVMIFFTLFSSTYINRPPAQGIPPPPAIDVDAGLRPSVLPLLLPS